MASADVWILTETHESVTPGDDYKGYSSNLIEGVHWTGESRTTVWSRFPVLQQIETHDPDTAICIEIKSPVEKMLVYGTVLPYGGAGSQYAYRIGGEDIAGTSGWILHYDSIRQHQADLMRLRAEYPNHLICFGGDLNQSRDGRRWGESNRQWYGTNEGRDLLSNCLQAADLTCKTEEDFVESRKLTSKSSIDHLCFNSSLAEKVREVGAWEADRLDEKPISDHNGVYVDLGIES